MSGRRTAALAAACAALATGPAWAAEHEVAIADYRYAPAQLTVKAGDTVRWTNREKRTSHSILFPAEGGQESERIFPGESWQRTFDKPGRYPYRCGPHPEMHGVVEVAE